MLVKKLRELLCPTNGKDKKEKKYKKILDSLPSIEKCTKCFINMQNLRVQFIDDFSLMDEKTQDEYLDLVLLQYKALAAIRNRDDESFIHLLKEQKAIEKISLMENNLNKTQLTDFDYVDAKDRPSKKIIIYGLNEDICAKVGCFLQSTRTETGHLMFDCTMLDAAKILALITVHADGSKSMWKSFKGKLCLGRDFLVIFKKLT